MSNKEQRMNSIVTKEKRYNNLKLLFSFTEFCVGLIFLIIILKSGYTINLEAFIRSSISNDYGVLIIFIGIIGLFEGLILFPLSFISEFLLEHHFKLSNQSFFKWILEKSKGLLVSIPLMLFLLVIFYFLLRTFPEMWWLVLGTVMIFFSIILSKLAPILIFPLFFKFSKLDEPELTENINVLCKKVGMNLDGVFKFDLSKNTKKGNAAFTGIGKTKRIILGDTLLENLTNNEIIAVLAHELGHFKLKHIWKGMTLGVISTYLGLFLVSVIYSKYYTSFGPSPWSVAALPLMGLILTLYGVIVSPVTNILSRFHERQADDYAVKLCGNAKDLITGLDKLSEQNLSDKDPHPIIEFLFYSHPSTGKRILRLQQKTI